MTAPLVVAPGVARWRVDPDGTPRAYTSEGVAYAWAPLPPLPGEPRSSQEAFLSSPVFETLLEGPRGSAKTSALAVDFFADVGRGFGTAWRGLLVRQNYKDFDTFADKQFELAQKVWGNGVQFNRSKGDMHFRWRTGERLDLRAIEHPRDYTGRHGQEYTWLGVEELTTWATPDVYMLLHSVVRTAVRGIFTRVRATTNPGLAGHGWVKDRFHLPIQHGKRVGRRLAMGSDRELPRVAIHSDLAENIVLLAADPDYAKKLNPPSEELRRAWVDGDWNVVAGGLVVDVWRDAVHWVEPFPIPGSWRITRSLDWGDARPFSVGWWAVADGCDFEDGLGRVRSSVQGDAYRIAEWYGMSRPNVGLGLSPQLVAKGIVERELAMGLRVRPGPADNELWRNQVGGSTLAQLMAQPVRVKGTTYPGVQWIRADQSSGSRKSGWVKLRTYLRGAHQPEEGVRTTPGAFFFNHLDQTRRMLPSAPRSERDPEDVDKATTEDHLLDEARYFFLSLGAATGKTRRTIGHY